MIIVADDAGFASVDRGIREFMEQTEKPVSADYMIEQPGAIERAHAMRKNKLASIGIHFEISRLSDAERVALSRTLKLRNEYLGQQPELRAEFIKDTRRQLDIFRQHLGFEPEHVSTHGNPNTIGLHIMQWWRDLMAELFDGNIPPLQLDNHPIRHNMYQWNTAGAHQREPMNPHEFAHELTGHSEQPIIEFVMHPALPQQEDADINMLFDARMREKDMRSAIAIFNSGVIENAGFEVVPVSKIPRAKQYTSHE